MENYDFDNEENIIKELKNLKKILNDEYINDIIQDDKNNEFINTKMTDLEFLIQQFQYENMNNSKNKTKIVKYKRELNILKQKIKKTNWSENSTLHQQPTINKNLIDEINYSINKVEKTASNIDMQLDKDKEKLEKIYLKNKNFLNGLSISLNLLTFIKNKENKNKRIFYFICTFIIVIFLIYILNKIW